MIDKKIIDRLFPFRKNNGLPSYRKNQREATIKILTCLIEQGYSTAFLDCSVGFGKSAVLVTIGRYIDEVYDSNSYYSTPYKVLQDQLKKDHREIPHIKGRSNYMCLNDREVSCEDGACQIRLSGKFDCKFRDNCKYLRAKERSSSAPLCCTNVSYLMSLKKTINNRSLFGNRDLLIVDEAHSMPEWSVNFASVSIYETKNISIPNYRNNFYKYVEWVKDDVLSNLKESKHNAVVEMMINKSNKSVFLSKLNKYKWIKKTIRDIKSMVNDYETNNEDWVYDIVKTSRSRKITFQPLKGERFLNNLLWKYGSKKILSSATIDPTSYINEGGLQSIEFDRKDCVFTAPSEFDPKNCPIYYKPLGKLTMDQKEYTFPKVIAEMNLDINKRKDRKGLIHTYSYANAEYIVDNIDPKLRPLLFVQDRDNREGSLKEWMNSTDPSVFVSTNMTEGLDLSNDLCRYQIYVKIGFPHTQNSRVSKRLSLGHWDWYYSQPIIDIQQASGRDVRNKNDWSEMIIYDSSFETILSRYRHKLKPWFLKRIVRVHETK